MKKVGIYSGTFDPVHIGHLNFALAALNKFNLERVVFLPENKPRRKIPVADFKNRMQMLNLATSSHPKLSALELGDERFTIKHSLPKLGQKFIGKKLVFLMGDDVFSSMAKHKWPDIEELLKSVEFIVAIRTNPNVENINADVVTYAAKIESTTGIKLKISFIKTDHSSVSSSKIRESLKTHQSTKYIIDSIKSFIIKGKIYE